MYQLGGWQFCCAKGCAKRRQGWHLREERCLRAGRVRARQQLQAACSNANGLFVCCVAGGHGTAVCAAAPLSTALHGGRQQGAMQSSGKHIQQLWQLTGDLELGNAAHLELAALPRLESLRLGTLRDSSLAQHGVVVPPFVTTESACRCGLRALPHLQQLTAYFDYAGEQIDASVLGVALPLLPLLARLQVYSDLNCPRWQQAGHARRRCARSHASSPTMYPFCMTRPPLRRGYKHSRRCEWLLSTRRRTKTRRNGLLRCSLWYG